MDLRRVAVVLPCDGLGDFPVDLPESDASAALHHWTAAWSPELLAATGRVPAVWSAFSLPDPEDAQHNALLIPSFCITSEVREWIEQTRTTCGDACLISESLDHRDQIIAALRPSGAKPTDAGRRWAPEFFALGYAFLQTELLTQSLVYASLIDPDDLEKHIVTAAGAAVAGQDKHVEESLGSAYDLLQQVREHSYPIETNLLDLVLVGPSTLGERLDRELAESSPKSYLFSPSVTKLVGQEQPHALEALRQRCIAATLDSQEPLAQLPPNVLGDRVGESCQDVQASFGQPAAAFVMTGADVPVRIAGAAESGGAPALVVAPLAGGSPVRSDQPRCVWDSPDGHEVESLFSPPANAGAATSLLRLAQRLSESLYRDHISAETFAAWAGCRHELFNDLRLVSARSTVLGKLVTLDEFFEDTSGAAPNGTVDLSPLGPRRESLTKETGETIPPDMLAGMADFAELLGGCKQEETGSDGVLSQPTKRLAGAVAGGQSSGQTEMVANAQSYVRPVLIGDTMDCGLCDLLTSRLIPDVPGLGYRVVDEAASEQSQQQDAPPRASESLLQNELLQALIDTTTGGVRSLRRHNKRRNRCSQKLIVRRGDRLLEVPTTCEGVSHQVLPSLPDRGAMLTQGELMDLKGRSLGRFKQTLVLLAQWDRLFIDIEIDTTRATQELDELRFASRIALPDASYQLYRGVQWTRLPEHTYRFHASDYVQAAVDHESVTLCTAGVRRYLRHGPRMIDCLLPQASQGVSRVRLAIALDENRPLRVALDLAAQDAAPATASCQASPGKAGWLVHLDATSVQVAALSATDGAPPSVRMTVVETSGRPADARLRLPRPATAAWWIDSSGDRALPLDLLDGIVVVPLKEHEQRTLEVTW